jgi:hypothetical protein
MAVLSLHTGVTTSSLKWMNTSYHTCFSKQGAVDFWWHHAMISDEAAEGIRNNCDFNDIGEILILCSALRPPRILPHG